KPAASFGCRARSFAEPTPARATLISISFNDTLYGVSLGHRPMPVVEILDSIQQDVHYTLRSIGREPAVFVALILTLTLGIGLNTTIMTAVDAILLRPPPFRNASRLQEIWVRTPDGSNARLTGADMWERV